MKNSTKNAEASPKLRAKMVGPTKPKVICELCGKDFRDQYALTRHKNRKYPCLRVDIPLTEMNNPNRCTYCGKALSTPSHLKRHLTTCKIKNCENIQFTQQRTINQKMEDMAEQLQITRAKMEKMEAEMINMQKSVIVAPTNVNSNNHTTSNNCTTNNINIVINDYRYPDLSRITLTEDELICSDNVAELIGSKVYWNPEVPENHSVFKTNMREKIVHVHESGKWQSKSGEAYEDVLYYVRNNIIGAGDIMVNKKIYDYDRPDSFSKLAPTTQKAIQDYNIIDQNNINLDLVADMMYNKRKIVKAIK